VRQDTPLSLALAQLGEQSAGAIVIVDADGTPSAIANEAAITAVPQQRRAWVTVGSVSRAIVPDTVLNTELRGEALLRAMSNFPIPEYLVVDSDNQIYGVLSSDDVQAALAGKRAQPKGLAT
jgi:predicted transcriptional regulator